MVIVKRTSAVRRRASKPPRHPTFTTSGPLCVICVSDQAPRKSSDGSSIPIFCGTCEGGVYAEGAILQLIGKMDDELIEHEVDYLHDTEQTGLFGTSPSRIGDTYKQALLDLLEKCSYLDDLITKTRQRFPSVKASEAEVRDALRQLDTHLETYPSSYFDPKLDLRVPTIVIGDHPPAFALAF
ncbi:hypothetical protein L198_01712 [Cryptococcus wingfieldii CBS 7118]|uniref:Uncharacterized protein n=1 Tax=Cryptococcus wingfieldii CBS 7118 TaxID=1295528 RepID=A0A1E3K058_9TREE|nr:hypothetical protein L198_01712 [Cryptococcus wingfieldii CBS 7118]ODO06480.1 hypothetical protein L198_01712 [Cryptococcus wingfieldii CBS 7118]